MGGNQRNEGVARYDNHLSVEKNHNALTKKKRPDGG